MERPKDSDQTQERYCLLPRLRRPAGLNRSAEMKRLAANSLPFRIGAATRAKGLRSAYVVFFGTLRAFSSSPSLEAGFRFKPARSCSSLNRSADRLKHFTPLQAVLRRLHSLEAILNCVMINWGEPTPLRPD